MRIIRNNLCKLFYTIIGIAMKKIILNSFTLILFFTFLISCKDAQQDDHSSNKANHETHWSYGDGETGPANWQNISEEFAPCGGKFQSPINISSDSLSQNDELVSLNFHYGKTAVNYENNGHTIKFSVDSGSTVIIGNKSYDLLQFHFHTLSEHTINGEHFPIEVHFVNKYSDSDFAAVGILFDEGAAYDLFSKYLSSFPVEEGKMHSTDTLDLSTLLPEDTDYFNYNGSLTTPPCSEVINWYVLKSHSTADAEQIKTLSEIMNNNYRPVMPLNGRKVYSFNN